MVPVPFRSRNREAVACTSLGRQSQESAPQKNRAATRRHVPAWGASPRQTAPHKNRASARPPHLEPRNPHPTNGSRPFGAGIFSPCPPQACGLGYRVSPLRGENPRRQRAATRQARAQPCAKPASPIAKPASRIPHPEPRIPNPPSRSPHRASRNPHGWHPFGMHFLGGRVSGGGAALTSG